MLKKIKSKWLKILIVLLIIAVVIFAALSVAWLVYYNNKVKPIMACLDKYECYVDHDNDTRCTYYSYEDEEEMKGFDISIPDFLEFYACVQAITPSISELDPETGEFIELTEYTYYFSYIPEVFGDNSYSLRIDHYPVSNTSGEDGVYITSGATESYHIDIDKDMNFISGDKTMYEEHYDELKQIFDQTKELVGEEAFQ